MFTARTDIASEARDLHGTDLPGIESRSFTVHGLKAEEVVITDPDTAQKLSKPVGRYTTIDISQLISHGEGAFSHCSRAVADTVAPLLPESVQKGPILAVGLGNRRITSDSVGPRVADRIIATRHLLKRFPDRFGEMCAVAVIEPGVLGSTGIESAETVCGLISHIRPSVCVLIDSLASQSHDGLCRSVQISDTGISPGSGVGNHRFEISRETVGVPCISIGVPTVVDARTLAAGIAHTLGISEDAFPKEIAEDSFFVTPKDIDSLSEECSRAISFGLNQAFQPSLSPSDIEILLS